MEEKAALLQHITDNMFDLVALTDPQGNFTFVGKSHEILGYDLETLNGKNVMDFVHPEDYQGVMEAFLSFLQNREDLRRVEYRIRCRNGSYLWLETMGKILTDDTGAIKELLFSSRDITHQKREEEQLKTVIQSTQGFLEATADMDPQTIAEDMRSLTGAAYVGFNRFDDNGLDFTTLAVAGVSDHLMKAARIMGFNPAGKKWPHDPDRMAKIQQATLTTFENLAVLTGKALPARLVGSLEKTFNTGQVIIVNIMKKKKMIGDFTLIMPRGRQLENPELATLYATQVGLYLDRVQYQRQICEDQKRLRETKERLHSILDYSRDAIHRYDHTNTITFANKAYCQLVGREKEQIIGRSLLEFVYPEEQPFVQEHLEALKRSGEVQVYSNWLRDSQGNRRWYEWTDHPVSDQDGAIVEYQSIGHDMTQHIEMKQQAEAANEAKSRYLEHMNHELRTPLNGFLGFIQLMEETRLDEEQQVFMHYMKHSANHLLGIVNNVLDHAKITAGQMQLDHESFLLEEEVQAALAPLHPLAREKNLPLEVTLGEDLPQKVVGDPQRLRQIILNLGGNAVKFTEEGRVHITLTCPETTEDCHTLQLVVEDTGPGMTEDTLSKLFQPFYQADDGSIPQSKGTGLGMPITRELVELMNGQIQVKSTPGEGTRVEVLLKMSKAKHS